MEILSIYFFVEDPMGSIEGKTAALEKYVPTG